MFKFIHKARKKPTTWWLKAKRKKSNLLSFTLFFWEGKKQLFMSNTTFPFIKVATLLFPGTPANLPPPFFHTWQIRTLDYYLIKRWSPHFCSHQFLVACLSLPFPLLHSSTNTTFPPMVAKGNPVPSHNEFVCSAVAQRHQAICLCQKE